MQEAALAVHFHPTFELAQVGAQPRKAVESDFAVDASGFSTDQFMRWFDVS